MKKIETKDLVKEKTEYTFEVLLNDIQDSNTDENANGMAANDNAEREHLHKLVIMQMLIYFTVSHRAAEYNDDDILGNAIDIKVNNDELLSGYLFHVSQNPQFDYSWNYMRKRKKSYSNFLVEAVRFLNNVVADINMLAGKPWVASEIHVVFDDVFDVILIEEKPYVKACVLWENFKRVAGVKRNYKISIKAKDCLLVAGVRKKPSDAEKFIDAALDKVRGAVVESEK